MSGSIVYNVDDLRRLAAEDAQRRLMTPIGLGRTEAQVSGAKVGTWDTDAFAIEVDLSHIDDGLTPLCAGLRQPFLAHGYLGLRDGTWVERVYEVSVMGWSEINREAHRKAEQEQGFHFWYLSWSEALEGD